MWAIPYSQHLRRYHQMQQSKESKDYSSNTQLLDAFFLYCSFFPSTLLSFSPADSFFPLTSALDLACFSFAAFICSIRSSSSPPKMNSAKNAAIINESASAL
mmetsp:Transcript_8123/g.10712  ORF Transcript_8123/g.10712 Transcript_8123/m.10712 type:complete len:102 (-) Transcript_8123:1347-1652(-)